MNRLERLINLVAALLAAEHPLSADELRRRVPGYAEGKSAFRRSFERDKEALREMGVPVSVEPVPGTDPPVDGYVVRAEDYYLRDPGLADDELAALHLAASTVELEGANGLSALWKLGGEVAEGGPAPARAALPGTVHLAPLFAAISEQRRVGLRYRGRDRHIDPHRLRFRNGHWYLIATDVDAQEARSYRLDRIESDVSAGDAGSAAPAPAELPESPPPPWETGVGEAVTARLLVDAHQASWAASQVGPSSVAEWRDDGSVLLDVRVTNREAFRSFVLGFLEHAELIGPPDLRADLVRWLETICHA